MTGTHRLASVPTCNPADGLDVVNEPLLDRLEYNAPPGPRRPLPRRLGYLGPFELFFDCVGGISGQLVQISARGRIIGDDETGPLGIADTGRRKNPLGLPPRCCLLWSRQRDRMRPFPVEAHEPDTQECTDDDDGDGRQGGLRLGCLLGDCRHHRRRRRLRRWRRTGKAMEQTRGDAGHVFLSDDRPWLESEKKAVCLLAQTSQNKKSEEEKPLNPEKGDPSSNPPSPLRPTRTSKTKKSCRTWTDRTDLSTYSPEAVRAFNRRRHWRLSRLFVLY